MHFQPLIFKISHTRIDPPWALECIGVTVYFDRMKVSMWGVKGGYTRRETYSIQLIRIDVFKKHSRYTYHIYILVHSWNCICLKFSRIKGKPYTLSERRQLWRLASIVKCWYCDHIANVRLLFWCEGLFWGWVKFPDKALKTN